MGEYRLYYDDKGKVLCYTVEDLPGTYIVVDKQIYLESRPDLIVKDGKIIRSNEGAVITKLVVSDKGIRCARTNVMIIASEEYTGPTVLWNTKQNEFRYH